MLICIFKLKIVISFVERTIFLVKSLSVNKFSFFTHFLLGIYKLKIVILPLQFFSSNHKEQSWIMPFNKFLFLKPNFINLQPNIKRVKVVDSLK